MTTEPTRYVRQCGHYFEHTDEEILEIAAKKEVSASDLDDLERELSEHYDGNNVTGYRRLMDFDLDEWLSMRVPDYPWSDE